METLQECRRNIVMRIKLTKFQPLTSFVTLGKSCVCISNPPIIKWGKSFVKLT